MVTLNSKTPAASEQLKLETEKEEQYWSVARRDYRILFLNYGYIFFHTYAVAHAGLY